MGEGGGGGESPIKITSCVHNMILCLFLSIRFIVFTVPSTPVGLESFKIQDSQITSSSDDGTRLAKYARLNEARSPGSWCTSNTAANSWLQVFLGKQYTLTHIALQGVNNYDVKSMTVKYENTKDGGNWTTYSKSVGGSSIAKVVFFVLSVCLSV